MKRFLTAASLVVVTTASATELKFGDVNYFLKQGQFNLVADMNMATETSRSETLKVENEGWFVTSNLGYGITDDLNAFIGFKYLWDFETHFNGGPSRDTAGIKFPRVGANYRLMKQDQAGVNVDFGVVANWNLMDSEVAGSVDDEGNTLNPAYSNYGESRNSVEVNARLGKKWNEANEFYVIAGAVQNFSGEYETMGTAGATTDVDSATDIKLGWFYQYRPVNEFMMGLSAIATRYGETDFETSGSTDTKDAHIDTQYQFVAKYLINDNVIAKFNFHQDRRSDFDFGDDKIERRHFRQWGFGVDWLF